MTNIPAEEESLYDGGLSHEAVSHDDEAKPLLIRSQARDTTTVAAVCHSVFDNIHLQIRNVVKYVLAQDKQKFYPDVAWSLSRVMIHHSCESCHMSSVVLGEMEWI